jgi:hypothetical protein
MSLFHDFVKEFGDACASHPGVVLKLSFAEAWAIFSDLQLSLKHPENTGPTADMVRGLAIKLQKALAPEGTALHRVAENGWRTDEELKQIIEFYEDWRH